MTVDHGLQAGLGRARGRPPPRLLRNLGLDPVTVVRVEVGRDGGPEAAARDRPVRGPADGGRPSTAPASPSATPSTTRPRPCCSGSAAAPGPARSPGWSTRAARPFWRPLLGIRRATTRAACAALELPVWDDPWNDDPAYTRVRLRTEALPLLEDVLGGGVAPALARTAALLREDLDLLDALAGAELDRLARRTGLPRGRRRPPCPPRCAAGCCGAGCAAAACPICRRSTWPPSTRCSPPGAGRAGSTYRAARASSGRLAGWSCCPRRDRGTRTAEPRGAVRDRACDRRPERWVPTTATARTSTTCC